jgi:acetyl-CoA carboxylase carboxyl transferase subunit beta
MSDSRTACEGCTARLETTSLRESLWICPACGFHLPMPARARLALVADPGSLGADIDGTTGLDPLRFSDLRPYPERLAQARATTGETESFISATATIGGVAAVVGALDFAFLGGTLSAAAGERVARAFERAADERRAIVLCTSSGGARMQEGTLSLFQMAKTAAALAAFRRTRRPYLALLGHPTFGGVAASFGLRADVLLAEPAARIGFAGPRVIEQLLGHALPPGFQRAESLFERGQVDLILRRTELRAVLARLVPLLCGTP